MQSVLLSLLTVLVFSCGVTEGFFDDETEKKSAESPENLILEHQEENDSKDLEEETGDPSEKAVIPELEGVIEPLNPPVAVVAEEVSLPSDAEVSDEVQESLPACSADDPNLANPTSVKDVIALINALPKPVTNLCLVQALKKPLRLFATKSLLSAQPAGGEDSPRFFLFFGGLTISVVASGPGAMLVEFAEKVSDVRSIKSELHFPITETLGEDAAYLEVLSETPERTRCAGCHANESPAGAPYPETAFISKALQPLSYQKSNEFTFDTIKLACEGKTDEKCAILNNILLGGYSILEFPAAMPTLF